MKNLQDAAAPSRCLIRSRNRGDMVQQTPETKATSGVHTDGIQYACSHWLLCPMVKSLRRKKLAMVVSISVGVHGYGISCSWTQYQLITIMLFWTLLIGMTMSPETSMLVNCQMWQIQANECNPCQAPPGQQGSRANEAPLSSPPLPPGLHGGGEAIGGESIGFPIECRMVLASSRFTTTEDHSAHGPVIPTTVNVSAVLNASVLK